MKKILYILILLSILIPVIAIADTTSNGMTIPTAHPRLFWTSARIAAAQTWASGEGYTGTTDISGESGKYDTLFTCIVLGNQTACDNMSDWAAAFTGGDGGCDSSAGCDALRWYGEAALLTYDWLYDELTTGERATIISNFNSWMTNQNNVTWGGPGMPTSNYFFGRNRNDFTHGVGTMEDNATAEDYLDYEFVTLWASHTNFVDSTGDTNLTGLGYAFHTQEGSQYGQYGLGYWAIMLPSATLLGRNMWDESAAFKSAVLQTIYTTMPTTSTGRSGWDIFAFGDDQNWVNGGTAKSRYYGDFMQAAATEYEDINIGKYAQQYLDTVEPDIGPNQASVAVAATPLAFSNLPLDYFASGPQYLYVRNNWTINATSLNIQLALIHGGTDHTHWSSGSFQVFRKGAHLIRETTTYSESIAGYGGSGLVSGNLGEAHNIPFVGGLGPSDAVGIFGVPGWGTVERLKYDANYSFVTVDLSLAYDHTTSGNPYDVSVVREFYYFRGIDALVVVDRIEKDTAARSITFVSHSETNPSVVSNVITSTVNGQEAVYTALVPASPSITIVDESDNGATADNVQYRIESEYSDPDNVVAYNIYAIEFDDSGSSSLTPSIEDSGSEDPTSGTFTITLDGSNYIVINKGTSSSGGTITANSSTGSLTDEVQVMTIADTGPVWADEEIISSSIGPGTSSTFTSGGSTVIN